MHNGKKLVTKHLTKMLTLVEEIFGKDSDDPQQEKPSEKVEEKVNGSDRTLKEPTGLFMTEADIGDEEPDVGEYGEEIQDLIDEGMDELVMPGGLYRIPIVSTILLMAATQ